MDKTAEQIAALRDIGTTWKPGPELDAATIQALPGLQEDGLIERQFLDYAPPKRTRTGEGMTISVRACWHFRLTDAGTAILKEHRLAALSARPAGDYVMVPVEPTEAMLEAADAADRGMLPWADQYRAMIAARPAVGEDAVTAAIEATGLLAGDEARDAARAAIAAITGDDHG